MSRQVLLHHLFLSIFSNYRKKKTRSKAGFLLKKDQINQSISSLIRSLAQG